MDDPDKTLPPEPVKRLERPSDATEVQESDAGGVASDVNGLYKLARSQPFMRHFYRSAHARFAARSMPETRVKQMIEAHPCWYKFCWWADASVLILAILAGVTLVGVALYKTVWL